MSARSRLAVAGICLCTVYAAMACNAVLGIEQAELESEASCNVGQGLTLSECAGSTTCEGCVGRACSTQELQGCLANSECRKALANYRTCQQDNCRDPSGSCGGCLEGGVGAGCFADCATECQGSEIVSLCDIYCSCMEANCADRPNVPTCRTDCRNSHAPWRTNCLLTHCERAISPDDDHCLHASDELTACPTAAPQADPDCDPEDKLVGYACDAHGECCSGFCDNGRCGL